MARRGALLSAASGTRSGGAVAPLLLALAGGCAVGPDFVRPEAPKAEGYVAAAAPSSPTAGGKEQRFVPDARVAGDWWRLFRCAKLDALVREAVASNASLGAARARLAQSQDSLRAGYGVFFPEAEVGAGVERQQYSPLRIGQNAPGSVFNLFTLSGTISYALDVWGGGRRALEGLKAQEEVQRYDLLGTYVMLTGNLVATLVARAGYRAQLEATEASLDLMRQQLVIAQAQAKAGTAPYANVLTIEGQMAATRAGIPPLAQKIDQADHLLATLAGRPPTDRGGAPVGLSDFTLPRDLPVTLPSKLVRQRPDVLEAEAEVHAASAAVGVATATLLPTFTLNGSYGESNPNLASLFTPNSAFWSFGAGVTAPLFRGGTLWNQRKAAIDAHRAALERYRQTALAAFAQVADALRAVEHDADALKAQTDALEASAEALRLMQINYQAGIATYLQVIVANAQYLQANVGHLQAVTQRLQDTVALYVALGGGWWNAPAPT